MRTPASALTHRECHSRVCVYIYRLVHTFIPQHIRMHTPHIGILYTGDVRDKKENEASSV